MRLSNDPAGTKESPKRQERDARAFCESRGWRVLEVYRDLDRSAYQRGVRRPEYERMLADAAAGRLDVVVVWKLDRLARSTLEFMRVWSGLERQGVELVSLHDSMDTTTPMGRAMVRIAAVFAELESDTMSLRIRAANQARAEQGRPHLGGTRPFGYSCAGVKSCAVEGCAHDGVSLIEREAVILRQVIARVLAGDSLRSIVRDLERRGVPTATGRPMWHATTLRNILSRPRIAGLRSHNGTVTRGVWEPIVSEETFMTVREVLADRYRLRGIRGTRVHLLAGLLRCRCGARMWVRTGTKNVKVYGCLRQSGYEACGRLCVRIPLADRHVVRVVHDAWVRGLPDSPTVAARRGELEARLDEDKEALAAVGRRFWIDRQMDETEYRAISEGLQQRIAQSRARLHRVLPQAAGGIPTTPGGLRRWWEAADHETRRAFLASVLTHITVHPARRLGRHFDPARLELQWR